MVAKLLIARSFARLLPLAEHKLCGPMDAVPGGELKENLNPQCRNRRNWGQMART